MMNERGQNMITVKQTQIPLPSKSRQWLWEGQWLFLPRRSSREKTSRKESMIPSFLWSRRNLIRNSSHNFDQQVYVIQAMNWLRKYLSKGWELFWMIISPLINQVLYQEEGGVIMWSFWEKLWQLSNTKKKKRKERDHDFKSLIWKKPMAGLNGA